MSFLNASVVWVPVSDIDRAVEFYCDSLGLQQEHRDGDWAMVTLEGLRIGLNSSESPAGDGGAVIAFQPDGALEQAVERLREQHVEIAGDITEHPWGRIATFKDPDGNDLQLYEPPSS